MDTAVVVALVTSAASLIVALLNVGSAVAVRRRVLAIEDRAKRSEIVRTKVISSAEELVACLDKLGIEIESLDFLIAHQGAELTEDCQNALLDIMKAKGDLVAKIPQARLYWPDESIEELEEVVARLASIPMDRQSLAELTNFIDRQQNSIAKEFRSKYVDS